tara:strand:- start:9890 stop:11149 length:1260 start_codon:yes stop_codon:yes gene_type:complete
MNRGATMQSQQSEIQRRVERFMKERILPQCAALHRQAQEATGEYRPALLDDLREQARAEGLWNLGLPELPEGAPGTRLSNLEFAPVAETLGWVHWAPEVFNCHAPDLPNMEMLQKLGTEAQKARWLKPMLEGKVASSFAMTEPDVASSDARNIACSITEDGDHFVITGRKWFVGNSNLRNWDYVVLIGVTDPDAPRTDQHSAVIVPTNAAGFEVVRQYNILGARRRWSPQAEVKLDRVRVPKTNLVGERGKGFAAAQVRLATARIHHCMRSIGAAEVALKLLIRRAETRNTFGKPVIERDKVREWIALSRIELNQARLLTLDSADQLDRLGDRGARRSISMIKYAVSESCFKVADRALQVFGGAGMMEDTPLADFLADMRAFRIYDGPSEIHLQTLARLEMQDRERDDTDWLGLLVDSR